MNTATPHISSDITYDITLRDGTVEQVVGRDAYQPEQSMTTFFRTEGRQTVDCWSVRMASFRTDQILAIRRLESFVVRARAARGSTARLSTGSGRHHVLFPPPPPPQHDKSASPTLSAGSRPGGPTPPGAHR